MWFLYKVITKFCFEGEKHAMLIALIKWSCISINICDPRSIPLSLVGHVNGRFTTKLFCYTTKYRNVDYLTCLGVSVYRICQFENVANRLGTL